jgi:Flp pilus assembly protein TadG
LIENLRIFSHNISLAVADHWLPPLQRSPKAECIGMIYARFLRNREGGAAPLLALGIIPLVAALGAAVDYSRAGSVRTAMQAAGDATALMLAKNASTLTAKELQQNATSYFQANFNRPDTQNLQVSASPAMAREAPGTP